MIPFNIPPLTGTEIDLVVEAINSHKICGDGGFTQKCSQWFEEHTAASKVLLTTSCTHALEMSAILSGVHEGDEVIMPSYTFVSTANAFALRSAKIVFIDIRPDTMNIDENLIEEAITDKTKVIVPVHYAGVACEMDRILEIAHRHGLLVVEDAAQGVMSTYHSKPLGSIGDLGCYSFHETKNYSMGEGGALLINREQYITDAEIIREKGTNRNRFLRGEVDKYTWVELGSSYLPSDINAAYLYAQLQQADEMNRRRLGLWNLYYNELKDLSDKEYIELPFVPDGCCHNGHMFYIKVENIEIRAKLIRYLKENGILSVFHYIPLHSSAAGQQFGRFHGEDRYTTKESERLLRLPMFDSLRPQQISFIVDRIKRFYQK